MRSPRLKGPKNEIVFFRGPPEWPEIGPDSLQLRQEAPPSPFTGKTTVKMAIQGRSLGFKGW